MKLLAPVDILAMPGQEGGSVVGSRCQSELVERRDELILADGVTT